MPRVREAAELADACRHRSMTVEELVKVSVDDGIGRVVLDRPDKRNAINREMATLLRDVIEQLHERDDLRVVILSGNGRSFCAGMDLKAVANDPEAMGTMLHDLSMATRSIRRLPCPTIAQVQGAAIGGGCGLMTVPDFSITHPEAKLGFPEVDLGICPAVVAPWLIRRIGASRARAMLLAGSIISGEDAMETGLATMVVPVDQLEEATNQLVTRLLSGSSEAIEATKNLLNQLDGSMDDGVLEEAAELSARIIKGEQAQERLGAMFNRS